MGIEILLVITIILTLTSFFPEDKKQLEYKDII
jgi:hypothetical protein